MQVIYLAVKGDFFAILKDSNYSRSQVKSSAPLHSLLSTLHVQCDNRNSFLHLSAFPTS
jgi:hypothetical protein